MRKADSRGGNKQANHSYFSYSETQLSKTSLWKCRVAFKTSWVFRFNLG